jgi:hypothetical protein
VIEETIKFRLMKILVIRVNVDAHICQVRIKKIKIKRK